jgi:hypothetical protein
VELEGQAVVQIADEAGVLLAQLQALHTPERIISVSMPGHGFHMLYTGSSTLIMVSYLALAVIRTPFGCGVSYTASAVMNCFYYSPCCLLMTFHHARLFISQVLWLLSMLSSNV